MKSDNDLISASLAPVLFPAVFNGLVQRRCEFGMNHCRNAHGVFQGSQADVVIVKGGDVVGSGGIELQFRIQYIQVDAYAAAVTDSRNFVGFFCLGHSGFGGTNLFSIGKDVEVVLPYFQFHPLTGLEELFLGNLIFSLACFT